MTTNQPVALVTGGGRGIGLGISRALVAEEYDLAFCGVRAKELVKEAIEALEGSGRQILYCRCDVSKAPERKQMLEELRERFGRLDVLINNAGVAPRQRDDILEATEENYDQVMDVNLRGPYFLTQAVANWMIEQRSDREGFSGSIINVNSISSTVASVNRGEYCLSKAGLGMATQLWAVRMAEYGIPVFEVRPGLTATDMTAGAREKYDKLIDEGLLLIPRWGTPEDIGKTVAALVRGDLPYATGQSIALDGGLTVPRF
jgi:3-oxoacyl-[acyl-carrier protein] reductase